MRQVRISKQHVASRVRRRRADETDSALQLRDPDVVRVKQQQRRRQLAARCPAGNDRDEGLTWG
ncbi:MAG TPA: hypothetical protein VHX59_12010 [Mycobacteriales bacterium]|nr:hypothetical protein [Mycobacteriales bacterium]